MPKRKKQSRNMIRMAVLLHQRLSGAGKPVSLLLPETEWRECQRLGAAMHHGIIDVRVLSFLLRHRVNPSFVIYVLSRPLLYLVYNLIIFY